MMPSGFWGSILLVFCACTNAPLSGRTPAGNTQTIPQQMQVLSYAKPRQSFSIKADTQNVLVIEIAEIKNPQKLPVTLQAAFVDGNDRWAVGEFSLYPADRPGKFQFNIGALHSKIRNRKNLKLEVSLNTDQLKGMDSRELLIKLARPGLQQ